MTVRSLCGLNPNRFLRTGVPSGSNKPRSFADNGLRYTPSGGAVTIRLQAVGKSGSGGWTRAWIEPENIPHLFERFYRTDWARAKDSAGTGLGLPIVKEIMEAHGGSISVTSEVNKGSVFTLRLPALAQQKVLA